MLKDSILDFSLTLVADCTTVKNSPCAGGPTVHHPPMCGQVEGFSYRVLNRNVNANDLNTNITVNVTFRSTLSSSMKPLYFMAFYGNAKPFDREIDVSVQASSICISGGLLLFPAVDNEKALESLKWKLQRSSTNGVLFHFTCDNTASASNGDAVVCGVAL